MDGTLWEKVEQFLYQLHYEDTDRESHYESKSYLEALQSIASATSSCVSSRAVRPCRRNIPTSSFVYSILCDHLHGTQCITQDFVCENGFTL